MKKIYLLIIILFLFFGKVWSQDCKTDYKAHVQESKAYFKAGDYENALTSVHKALIAAEGCDFKPTEADGVLIDIATAIRKERDDLDNNKKDLERQQGEYSALVTNLKDLLKDEKTAKIVGFSQFSTNFINTILPGFTSILNNSGSSNDYENIADLHFKMGNAYGDMGNIKNALVEYNTAYILSKQMAGDEKLQLASDFNEITTTYLRSAEAYSHLLSDLGENTKAQSLLNETHNSIVNLKIVTAANFDALAQFENAFANSLDGTQIDLAWTYKVKALFEARKAIEMDNENPLYKKTLLVCLNNLARTEPNRLNTDSIIKFKAEASALADSLGNKPAHGDLFLTAIIDSKKMQAEALIKSKQYKAALDTLNSLATKVGVYTNLKPYAKNLFLVRADLFSKMANIYKLYLRDSIQQKNYLKQSKANWVMVLNDKNSIPTELNLFRDVYMNDMENITVDQEIYMVNDRIVKSLSSYSEEFKNYPQVAYVSGFANLTCAKYLITSKKDSTSAPIYLNHAIDYFESSQLFKKNKEYSEDYAKFCDAYKEKLAIDIAHNADQIDADYNKIITICLPLYKKFDYDITLEWSIACANKLYGEYLFKKGNYKGAIPPLEFASNEGIRSSTDYLIKIYGLDASRDQNKQRIYLQRSNTQIDDDRTVYTIPVMYNGTPQTINIYILDRVKGYSYNGIEDQAKWALQAKNIIVDKKYVEAFTKYQKEAWDNNKSFRKLSGKAMEEMLNSVYISMIVSRYKFGNNDFKNGSEQPIDYEAVRQFFEDTLTKGHDISEALRKDAIKFYLSYATFLRSQNRNQDEKKCYDWVLNLDKDNKDAEEGNLYLFYSDNKKKIIAPEFKTTPDQLKAFLGWFLDESNYNGAEIMSKKILNIRDDAKTRDEISSIFFAESNQDKFNILFTTADKKRIQSYWTYFANKSISDTSDIAKRNYFFHLTALGDNYLKINNNDSIASVKKTLGQFYSTYVWYSLLTKNYENAQLPYYVGRSRDFDPLNKFTIAINIEVAIIINNDFETAQKLYNQYKDTAFIQNGKSMLLKDFLLSSITYLEKANTNSNSINQISKLLHAETTGNDN